MACKLVVCGWARQCCEVERRLFTCFAIRGEVPCKVVEIGCLQGNKSRVCADLKVTNSCDSLSE